MQTYEKAMSTGERWETPAAKFFMLLEASYPVDITFRDVTQKKIGKVEQVEKSFKVNFHSSLISVLVESATAQTVKIATSQIGEIDYSISAVETGAICDLNGCTFAEQSGVETNNVVTALANTGGIYIAIATVLCPTQVGVWGSAVIQIGTNKILKVLSHSGQFLTNCMKNILCPPNVALDLVVQNSANGNCWVWYKLL